MSLNSTLAKPSRGYANYVLLILSIANVLSVADRGVMSLLLQPIKRDLHASDTEMSLLTGVAFVLFYSLFGIPIAQWSDRGNRRSILSIGIGVWSIMTSFCGFAGSFALMAVARAGVGVGEATCTPTSMSLIADYYARRARPRMIALFNIGAASSAFVVTPFVGVIADHFGWRAAFILLGIPGVIVALLVRFTVREPVRGMLDEAPQSSPTSLETTTLAGAVRAMLASKPFMLILLGTAITALGSSTMGAWGAALAMRSYHVTATQIASIQAPIVATASIVGGLGGGFLTGWVAAKRKSERWIILLPALVSLLTVPAGLIYAEAPSFPWYIVGGIGGSFTVAFRAAPFLALSLELVPARYRGMAAAATLIASNVVGGALGPLAVGMLSDHFTPSLGPAQALRHGMLLFAPTMLALGVAPFFLAIKYFDENGLKTESRPQG